MAPCQRVSCWRATSCSSRGCTAAKDTGPRLWGHSHTAMPARCGLPSRRQSLTAWDPARRPQLPSRLLSLELLTLCGGTSPFSRVESIRAMARHIVDLLTETPLTASSASSEQVPGYEL